jgi:hypothetical protein
MGYILSLEIEEALDLIQYAADQKIEELLFARWISELQLSMSFEDFKAKLRPENTVTKSSEEILMDVKSILILERGSGLGDI